MVHGQNGKIKGKEQGGRKDSKMEEVPFAGGGKVYGVRCTETFFRWIPFSDEGVGENLLRVETSSGG